MMAYKPRSFRPVGFRGRFVLEARTGKLDLLSEDSTESRELVGKQFVRTLSAAVLTLTFAAPQCWAWGREGHRLTALVAENYLTPETRAQIVELLHKESIVDVASWADEYRQDHPETAKWHFVDIPSTEAKFDRTRDCPLSTLDPASPWRDCITDRILYFEGRLGDETLTPDQRAVALKFVVHLIGDVHQPFHAIGDARGGNGVAVTFKGSRQCGSNNCNLHGVWDDALIEDQNLNEKKYTDRLLQEIKDNHWDKLTGGDPTAWANISHHYAVEALAPNGALLTKEYAVEEGKVVDAELALGGLRLARVLNRILGHTSAPGTPAKE
jgi:hypothetical protein